jgi:hypothetical protein
VSGENQDYRISGANRNTAVLAVQEVNKQYSRPCCIAKESTMQHALLCRKKTRSTAGFAVSEDKYSSPCCIGAVSQKNQQYSRHCCVGRKPAVQQALLYRKIISSTAGLAVPGENQDYRTSGANRNTAEIAVFGQNEHTHDTLYR